MRDEFRQLRLAQLDRALAQFRATLVSPRPRKGWVKAIREATGISASDLAERMGTSRQLTLQQEKAESEDRITLKSLRALAQALDCDLVYALVPRVGSLEEFADLRLRVKAKANVLGVEHSMALENQASGNLDHAIEAETDRLTRKRKRK
jgi:predicted DNA-binding mobile mystery protein A